MIYLSLGATQLLSHHLTLLRLLHCQLQSLQQLALGVLVVSSLCEHPLEVTELHPLVTLGLQGCPHLAGPAVIALRSDLETLEQRGQLVQGVTIPQDQSAGVHIHLGEVTEADNLLIILTILTNQNKEFIL